MSPENTSPSVVWLYAFGRSRSGGLQKVCYLSQILVNESGSSLGLWFLWLLTLVTSWCTTLLAQWGSGHKCLIRPPPSQTGRPPYGKWRSITCRRGTNW